MKCPKCMLTQNVCYCANLKQIKLSNTHITVIRSYKERNISTNTARLGDNCIDQLNIIDRGFQDQRLNGSILMNDFHVIYLFPEENALSLADFKIENNNNNKIQLIIPDGSWSQAKKIKRREPWLKAIPSVFIPGNLVSKYHLRKQKSLGHVCTIEAINYALAFLEKKYHIEDLQYNLELLVEAHLKFRPWKLK